MQLHISYGLPSIEEYNMLRRLAEWPVLDRQLVEVGLSNSLFSVVVRDNADVILGMGRVIGDGAIYLHIQDVIVRPEYQRRGIGKMIMEELMTFVNGTGGNYTNIGLMCSKGREPFYKNFGFIERPSGKFGAGMIMVRE